MKEYIITSENYLSLCDEICRDVEIFCGYFIEKSTEIQRYRLTVEQYLAICLNTDNIGRTISVDCYKKAFRRPAIEITLSGEPIVFETLNHDEVSEFTEYILKKLGLSPNYSYKGGKNILKFEVKKNNRAGLLQFGLVILASIIVGFLGHLLPSDILSNIQNNIITPVYNKFFEVLGCVAGPMIFLSVAWGVCGIGDTTTLSRVGKRMIFTFFGVNILVSALGIGMIFFFDLNFGASGGNDVKIGSLFDTILSIIPSNVVDPFVTGNTLQIIFIGFVVGLALLFLGKRTDGIAMAIKETNLLVQFLMEFISKIVPFVVFLVIVSLLWSDSINMLLTSWKLLVVLTGAIVVTCIIYYTYTSIHLKVKIHLLLKKCFPSFIIAFATASSAATFSTNVTVCKKKLGISSSLTSFGVPMAMVMHNPIAALNNLAVALFFASYFKIECSLAWILTAIFLSALLAVSTPPIPGGGTLGYTLLFAQLNIPAEALAVVLSIDLITDFIITAAEMYCLPPALANVSDRIGMLDKKILRKD